jgi:acetylglutamate kinase
VNTITSKSSGKHAASICIKVGGNALTDEQTKRSIASQIREIVTKGLNPVIIHGGGIEIRQLLDDVNLKSEFASGHRITDKRAIGYVEMALSGKVNKELTALLNRLGVKAVGISGRDAAMVTAVKRFHSENGKDTDLGFVGNPDSADISLVQHLLDAGYVPVISPVSSDDEGNAYNINADMFAGFLAGELRSDKMIFLTNIDGLLKDVKDPNSVIHELTPEQARSLFGTVIQGGMIPKIEACLMALDKGAESVHIINGTKEGNLLRIFADSEHIGTSIIKNSK